MEETKVIKKIIRKPINDSIKTNQDNNGNNTFFKVLNVILFIMVFVIFIRGFNVKNTVRDENLNTQIKVQEMVIKMKSELENSRQIDKNEILSAFALYSRLDVQSLKEREEYHKQQQNKYENMANQYNQGLNSLAKEIKTKKDSIK